LLIYESENPLIHETMGAQTGRINSKFDTSLLIWFPMMITFVVGLNVDKRSLCRENTTNNIPCANSLLGTQH
jgi:hypothetical protein